MRNAIELKAFILLGEDELDILREEFTRMAQKHRWGICADMREVPTPGDVSQGFKPLVASLVKAGEELVQNLTSRPSMPRVPDDGDDAY